MINKIRNIHDVLQPVPLVININADEVVNLDIQVKSGSSDLTCTNAGTFTLKQDDVTITSSAGTVYNGRATVEVGQNYSTKASLPAGKYDFTFTVTCGSVTAYITGVLISKSIPVGAVRNAAVESNVASALTTIAALPTTYLGIHANADSASKIGSVDRIYVDTTVSPALPKMDRTEYADQSAVTAYAFHSIDADYVPPVNGDVPTAPYRKLTNEEITSVLNGGENSGVIFSFTAVELGNLYVAAGEMPILSEDTLTNLWFINDATGAVIHTSSAAATAGVTVALNSVATDAANLADKTKWTLIYTLTYDEDEFEYVIDYSDRSSIVTYTLAFLGD